MNELEMIKAFAKLEGQSGFELVNGEPHVAKNKGWVTLVPYNPIQDLALNCTARDKWDVNITYHHNQVAIWIEATWIIVKYKCKTEIPRAVIECILKSEGLYE